MTEEISKYFGFVNRIFGNVYSVDLKEVKPFYENLCDCDCLVLAGAGRSFRSAKTPGGEMARNMKDKTVMNYNATGFPGYTLRDGAENLEKRYDRINFLVVSRSGETKKPKTAVNHLVKHIQKTGSKKISVNAITANEDSTVGKAARKYGSVVLLKGVGTPSSESKENKFRERGILYDVFELGALSSLQMLAQMLYEKANYDRFPALVEEEFSLIGKTVDHCVDSKFCKNLIDAIEGNANVYCGGLGGGNEVSEMSSIRLMHLKRIFGSHAYTIGEPSCGNPVANDAVIFTTCSGGKISRPDETKEEMSPIIDWFEDFEKLGTKIFTIVGNENSPIAKASKHKVIIEEEIKPGQPRKFYERAAYVHSTFPVSLCERWIQRGRQLPPEIWKWYHTTAE